MKVTLQPGDVFCVSGNMGVVSKIIVAVEAFWSKDKKAEYGHSGIIINSMGETVEALWTVSNGSLDSYKGKKVIIARANGTQADGQEIPPIDRVAALGLVNETKGTKYPIWRLFLGAIPPLASRISSGKRKVCSELVAFFLQKIGARTDPWQGVSPDTLADEWIRWKNFDIIFEGEW